MKYCTTYAVIGPPTAGKSAVIRYLHKWVNRDSGICVMFLDETATILLQNIDKKLLEEQNPILRQIYIFRTQKICEDELSEFAETAGVPTLVISDRGLNDLLCYCTPEEADQYFTEEELALLHNHYNAVFYLEPGSTAEIEERLASNPARIEKDPAEVLARCEKTYSAWIPSYPTCFIPQFDTIENKAKYLAKTINETYGVEAFLLP